MAVAPNLAKEITRWETYLASERRLSARTQEIYEAALEDLMSFLPEHLGETPDLGRIGGLRITDFRAWLAHMRRERQLSNATIAQQISAIRSFYRFLERQNLVENPAVHALKAPKKQHRIPRPVAEEGVRAMMGVASGEDMRVGTTDHRAWVAARDSALVVLIYGSGLRISEALSLTPAEFDGSDSLRVIGKGNKERIVPILPVIREAVTAYQQACPHPLAKDEALFRGIRGGSLGSRAVQKWLRACVPRWDFLTRQRPMPCVTPLQPIS